MWSEAEWIGKTTVSSCMFIPHIPSNNATFFFIIGGIVSIEILSGLSVMMTFFVVHTYNNLYNYEIPTLPDISLYTNKP